MPTIYVLSRNLKKYQGFLSENFQFLEVKFSIYLNRLVFVMYRLKQNLILPHFDVSKYCWTEWYIM